MGEILLRKLTEKSVIPYGKYKGVPVGNMMDYRKSELVWLYFNVEWISFTDSVLEKLHIYEARRIRKPGIDKEAFYKMRAEQRVRGRGTLAQQVAENMQAKAEERKAKARLIKAMTDEDVSKGVMQAMNHGHKRYR